MKESVYGAVIGALSVAVVFTTGVAVYSIMGRSTVAQHSASSAVSTPKASTPSATMHIKMAYPPASDTNVLQIIQNASKGKFKVDKAFAGPYPNMTGVEVSSSAGGSGRMLLWVITPPALSHPVIFSGNTYDINGTNLTKQYIISEGLITPAAAKAASVIPMNVHDKNSVLQHIWDDPASFVLGTKGPEIAVMIDPDCVYCHQLLTQVIFPLTKDGKIRAKIITTGWMHPNSAGKAWHILAKGSSALMKNETGFNVGTESGAIQPYTAAQSNSVKIPGTDLTVGQGVMANNILLAAIGNGRFSTPTLVFNKNGKLSSLAGAISKTQLEQYLGIH